MVLSTKKYFLILVIFIIFIIGWLFNFVVTIKAPINIFTLSTSPNKVLSTIVDKQYQKPTLVQIPSVNIVANVERVGIDKNGAMGVPKNFNNVGWLSSSSKLGQTGNLVMSGHYDTTTGAPAAFYNLTKVNVGDLLYIDTQLSSGLKSTKVYKVTQSYLVDPNNKDHIKDVYKNTKVPTITLITCNGIWDSVASEYSNRLVVKGELVAN